MGLFGKSKSKQERKEALATLKNLEKKPQHRRMASTTDPSTAITELQPWQVGQEKAQQGLSGFVHKDVYGREITEPDLTNPTRNRWERPLETIRAFQESIDKGYRRSYYGGEVDGGMMSGPPSQAGRSFVRGAEAHADAVRADSRYAGNFPATPLSHSSGEDHAAFGVMGGRNHLNNGPGMVTNAYRPGYVNGMNNGHSEAGYGDPVYPQGSRVNSYSQPDDQYYGDTNGSGAYPYNGNQNGNPQQQWGPQSNGAVHPVAQQTAAGSSNYQQPNGAQPNGGPYQQPQDEAPKRNFIKLASTSASQAPPPEAPPKRKSWLGRRISRGD